MTQVQSLFTFVTISPRLFVLTHTLNIFALLRGEKHLITVSENGLCELFVYEPKTFWSDVEYKVEESYWGNSFKISFMRSDEERKSLLRSKKGFVFIGKEIPELSESDFRVNPDDFMAALNWWRAEKTPYEIACLREASRRGAKAHKRVKEIFLSGPVSELALHEAYLKVLEETEDKLPYHSIIAFDEKAAILHYQHKRLEDKVGSVFLIDAGASFCSYGSDITRTHLKPEVHSVFKRLYEGVEQIQQVLCFEAREGDIGASLQVSMHQKLSELLIEEKILLAGSVEEILDKSLSSLFCPHGFGHMLGIQVHDVAGDQKNIEGDPCDHDSRLPRSRMNRPLRENEVITVEPGLYFIPFLLQEKRQSKEASLFNWDLIDQLVPFGGIRIEDNIVVQKNAAPINLTREFL